jgi:hypothetical protein
MFIILFKAGISGSPFKPQSKIQISYFVPNFVSSFLSFGIRDMKTSKVNSVQEACTKCFVVHTLKFEILQFTWKKFK